MSVTNFINDLASKGRDLPDIASKFLNNAQYGPWIRTGFWISGTTLALYTVNRILNIRALNHGTQASFDWSKEIVVITGGSGGIGGETVKRLAAGGTTVVILDLVPPTYPKAENVHFYKCNLTDYEQLQSVAAKIRSEIGEPTVIIANAGIFRGKPILEAEQSDIQLTFGVNTLGLLWTAKTFLPALVSRNHGHFLIMASQVGYFTSVGATDYGGSKAAAISIYEGLHSEIKHVHRASGGIRSVPGMVSITPQSVAETIEQILKSGRAQNLIVPWSVRFTPLIRVLPDWIRVQLQDLAAVAFNDLQPRDDIAKLAQFNGEESTTN